jgi:predicted nucleotidyltransferase
MGSTDEGLLQSGEFDDVVTVVGKLYGRGGVAPGCLMLVGARCRDLLNYRCGLESPGRTTQDTDVAVAVASWDEFRSISDNFPSQSPAWQRVIVDGVPVDIVPFGDLEEPPGHIGGIDRSGPWGMDVSGYGRVFSTADEVVIDGTGTLKIPTVAGFALLKLFAWLDRGPRRIHKDASDLSLILFWYYRDTDYLYEEDNLWVFDDEQLLDSEWYRAAALMAESIRSTCDVDTLENLSCRIADCDRRELTAHFSCRESSALSGRVLARTVEILLDRLVSGNGL